MNRVLLTLAMAASVGISRDAAAQRATSRDAIEIDSMARIYMAGVEEGLARLRQLLSCQTDSRVTLDACAPCRILDRDDPAMGWMRHSQRVVSLPGPEGAEFVFPSTEAFARCIRHGIGDSSRAAHQWLLLRVELAANRLLHPSEAQRTQALLWIDRVVDSLVQGGSGQLAAQLIANTGEVYWDRAQRMLARPLDLQFFIGWNQPPDRRRVPLHSAEDKTRRIATSRVTLRQLPHVPTSSGFGEGEAEWARRLFFRAAALDAGNESNRSRYTRLALATFVAEERWAALDSAAARVLEEFPADSVAPLARALAAYRSARSPFHDYTMAMTRFDTALRALPAADSVRYDEFDRVLSSHLDSWRHRDLGADRLAYDMRGWMVLDPIWLTPVQEVRLERRARMTEADFAYAYIAEPNRPGSETAAGVLVLKRGRLATRWRLQPLGNGRTEAARHWQDGTAMRRTSVEGQIEVVRSLYSDDLQPQQFVHFPLFDNLGTIYRNATVSNMSLDHLPFNSNVDTIDVTAARFRTLGDSIDMYVGARLPFRSFWHRHDERSVRGDSLVFGVTVATPDGRVLQQQMQGVPLPNTSDVATTSQWHLRVAAEHSMHRVEALHARQLQAARGSRKLTSEAASSFATTGFGISEVILADSIGGPASLSSWRELRIRPSGGVVEPRMPISLAWELYDLARDEQGNARWRVSIRRENGHPFTDNDVQKVIIGGPPSGAKILVTEPGASFISYERLAPARPVIVDHVRFPVTFPDGDHVLIVAIEDLIGGHTTSSAVALRVLQGNWQARRYYSPPRRVQW